MNIIYKEQWFTLLIMYKTLKLHFIFKACLLHSRKAECYVLIAVYLSVCVCVCLILGELKKFSTDVDEIWHIGLLSGCAESIKFW